MGEQWDEVETACLILGGGGGPMSPIQSFDVFQRGSSEPDGTKQRNPDKA